MHHGCNILAIMGFELIDVFKGQAMSKANYVVMP